MATRRHRIVIKPNIRPTAASKQSPVTAIKPKTPHSECPSPAIRPLAVPVSYEELHQPLAREADTDRDDLCKVDTSTQVASLPEKDAVQDTQQEGTESKQTIPYVTIDVKSKLQCHDESSHTRKEKAINKDFQDGLSIDVVVKASSKSNTKSRARSPPVHHTKSPRSGPTEAVINEAIKQKSVADSENIIKQSPDDDNDDDEAVTPSEKDSSCISEVASQIPDDEQREEICDKSQKKNRRQKFKKLRSEPLPSREKSPDRQKMKMSDLLCWNPQQNFFPRKNKKKGPLKSVSKPMSPTPSVTTLDDDDEDNDKESTNQSASLPAPQVMIGPDGNVILNAESLIIQTQKDDRPKEVLEDNDDDRYLNTNSYRKYKKAKLWTEKETEKFFVGLSMCGTDFSLLTNLLTHRTRRELKNKFHREERRNRELVDKALASRQQYDLTPFKKMASEDDKREAKKQIKKNTPKDEKVPRKRGKKRKKELVDEEDDWIPELEEENEENQNKNVAKEKASNVKHLSKVKKELDLPGKSKHLEQNILEIPEDSSKPFVPGHCAISAASHQMEVAVEGQYTDLDDPKVRLKPSKTYSKLDYQNRENQQQMLPPSNAAANNSANNVIQDIPGCTQVQIEVEGVQNLVQGVLIPSHMVSHIAPQLGICGSTAGMQVLLVQEETESGSMVHVYVLPESDTKENVDASQSATSNQLSFTSPIPSPHPTTAIQNQLSVSPFSAAYNTHPLSNMCSSQPITNPTSENHKTHSSIYQQQVLSPQPHSATSKADTSLFNEEQQDVVVTMDPSIENNTIERQSQGILTMKHNSSKINEQISMNSHIVLSQTNSSATFTSPSHQSVSDATKPSQSSVVIDSHQIFNMYPYTSLMPLPSDAQQYNTSRSSNSDHSPCNSNKAVDSSALTEDDCIIINSDKSESCVDMSGTLNV